MTSRGYAKSCTRKVNTSSITAGSIQFDKLFRENSNRPSAAKSAGTVGKWGITSFTSTRSTDVNGRPTTVSDNKRPGSQANKRQKLDYGNQNSNEPQDVHSKYSKPEEIKAAAPAPPPAPAVNKPKKFFKSRGAGLSASSGESNQRQEEKQQQLSGLSSPDALKSDDSFDSQAETTSRDAAKPPIVLRICKGTARLVCSEEIDHESNAKTNVEEKVSSQASNVDVEMNTDTDYDLPPVAPVTRHKTNLATNYDSPPVAPITRHKTNLATNNDLPAVAPTTRHKTNLATSYDLPAVAPITRHKTNLATNYDLPAVAPVTRHKGNSATNYDPPVVAPITRHNSGESEMRTTRSRAKSLRSDVTTTKPVTPVISSPKISSPKIGSPNSGLSLTLRKSVDSNNKLVSHYDIVKTDCSPSYSHKQPPQQLEEQATPKCSDHVLPTTTQELLEILSSDAQPGSGESIGDDEISESKEEEPDYDEKEYFTPSDLQKTEVLENPKISGTSEQDVKMDEEPKQHVRQRLYCETDTAAKLEQRENKEYTMKNLDQDWDCSSDDSEGAPGNLVQSESQRVISHSEPTAVALSTIDKPTVIKKGSFFKTRSSGSGTTRGKRRALYKHKWCDNTKTESTNDNLSNIPGTSGAMPANLAAVTFDEESENSALTRVTTYPETSSMDLPDDFEQAVTSIRCGKNVKGYYTVVKNVKKAHQIQESGEFQEYNDDVEYILDALRRNNPNATRCLSALRLAEKCMAAEFRMHVRAHGTVAKFFKALDDATSDQSLALCTATVMFVLSQDRLAMDLDRDCLELMLSLLECDAGNRNALLDDCGLSYLAELMKNKEKVRQICAEIQKRGHAEHLNLDQITAGQLAMETLLSLTSKRAGEWFKEELRELGGLEHIVKTITDCHRCIISSNIIGSSLWSEELLDKLRKVDRCLRVLENVTHMNEENQMYLLRYNEGVLVTTLASLYNFAGSEILKYPTANDCSDKSSIGAVIRECLFAVVKVLINLTHRFNGQSVGGKTVGCHEGIVDNSLHLILQVPHSLPDEKRFDMMMLGLILLINLVEQCEDNKRLLMMSETWFSSSHMGHEQQRGLAALIGLFYMQEELARLEAQKTDAILDGKKDTDQKEENVPKSKTSKSQEEFIEETVAKLLQKAGRHMEHTMIAAYVVLLIGHLIMDNKSYEELVRNGLPNGTFDTMIAVLQKFFNFMNLTASNETSSCGIAATEKVIKFLQMSDARLLEERSDSSQAGTL